MPSFSSKYEDVTAGGAQADGFEVERAEAAERGDGVERRRELPDTKHVAAAGVRAAPARRQLLASQTRCGSRRCD